jgi:hypothetical protein
MARILNFGKTIDERGLRHRNRRDWFESEGPVT